MPNKATWVVVADSAQAKIFRLVKFPKIEEVAILDHPESRLHDQDLVSSKQGRTFQRGGPTRHAYVPRTDPKLLEAQSFATFLSQFLSTSLQKGEFGRLYVIASPAFLGILRQHIDHAVRDTIVAEAAKDMSGYVVSEIEHQLSEMY